MFIVYLNVCLDIAIRIFIGTVKKNVCGKFLFFSGFSDMPWFLDLSLIIHEVVKENVISEKPLKKSRGGSRIFRTLVKISLLNIEGGGGGSQSELICILFYEKMLRVCP
jgi:hypothetical protein